MKRFLLALSTLCFATGVAAEAVGFRAAWLPPRPLVNLGPLAEDKAFVADEEALGRLRVGAVREVDAAAPTGAWTPVAGGYAVRFRVGAQGALGLRVRLDLGAVPGMMEMRAQGEDGRVESMRVDPGLGPQAWSPWTRGAVQSIELFSAVLPSADAVSVGALVHFTHDPMAKAAGTCTVPTLCTTGNPVLDAAIAERKKSIMKINFIDGGSSFSCTATLINTDRFPAAFVLTANHCIGSTAAANSISSIWFFESNSCLDTSASPAQVQVAGGMALQLANYNVDTTLLLMNASPPAGATYAPVNAVRLASTDAVVSLSHPAGDTARVARGTVSQEYRVSGFPHDMYGVRFSSGIIEGGSSGSGLFTLAGNSLQLRGVLSGSTVRNGNGMSCTNLNEEALYGRYEIFGAQAAPWVRAVATAADDAPNRIQDIPAQSLGAPLNNGATNIRALGTRRIDYAGDIDVFPFTLSATSVVSAWSEGPNFDTVGTFLDSAGEGIEANDDAEASNNHFGITRRLTAGTYYLQVSHWDATTTGNYTLNLRADNVDQNYTDLWWNPNEPGWGMNINHQGNTLFATLFTYDFDGTPMWLVMSGGTLRPDGTYSGPLFRTTGPAFNAVPFVGTVNSQVGTMTLAFQGSTNTLTYTYNGTAVTKAITRQRFGNPPSCGWSLFDRSYARNYQDLWWNPNEVGWGVNFAHQGNTLFATLFTYDAGGKGMWLVMSNGTRIGNGQYAGTLFRTSGPAFNAQPWTPAINTAVGTMSVDLDGDEGTLRYTVDGVNVVKAIRRQVFGNPKTECN